jgi:hypothetical protein
VLLFDELWTNVQNSTASGALYGWSLSFALNAGNWSKACDFKLSIKPHTLDFLYAGFKVVADQPGMVIRGWDACGLLAPFKPELKDECYQKALAAIGDPEHPYYPLFPNHDRSQPPPGDEEPTPGPVEAGVSSAMPMSTDPEEQNITERADAVMAQQTAAAAPAAPAKRGPEHNSKLYSIFTKRAKTR